MESEYYCSACGNTLKRDGDKKYIFSWCNEYDKEVRLTNTDFLKKRKVKSPAKKGSVSKKTARDAVKKVKMRRESG